VAHPLILALGGTRSGKSRYGLAATRRLARDGRAWFLATAWPGDPELDDRIARHRRERPPSWPTLDVGVDLATAIARTTPTEPVLIDGLTLWLSAILGDVAPDGRPPAIDAILDGPVAAALEAIAARPGPVVVVSDEIGSGAMPMHPAARAYGDLVGIVHQRLAAIADEAYLLVAGLPLTLKGDRR
jgi:adenosylcobinamide kinase/adenosylcobinamide-phosphate guanylyltransferase